MYSDKQIKYLKILQEQYNSGKINKKKYRKEVYFVRDLIKK